MWMKRAAATLKYMCLFTTNRLRAGLPRGSDETAVIGAAGARAL